MIVVNNLNDAKQATQGFTTVHFGFSKPNFIQRLTPEFDNIIAEGKKFGNKTVASFWYLYQIHNFIYPDNVVDNMPPEVLEWERDACISWAESKGIDIVCAPEISDELVLVNISNLEYYKALVDKIWIDENFNRFSTDVQDINKKKGSFVSRLIANTGWKYATSADGITSFLKVYFTNKFTNSRAILIDTIRSQEGIPYSSNYSLYSAKEKEVLAKVEPLILSFDFSQNINGLISAIENLDNEVHLKVRTLNKFEDPNVIGPNKTLIDSYIYIDAASEAERKYQHFAIVKI